MIISPLNKQSIAIKFQFINLSAPLSGTLSIPIKKHFCLNAIYLKKERENYRLILTEDKPIVPCIKRIGWRDAIVFTMNYISRLYRLIKAEIRINISLNVLLQK